MEVDASRTGRVPSPGRGGRAVKRAVDLAVSTIGLVVMAPLLVVLLVVSALVLRANPLFLQRRVGRRGDVFLVPKIRSLPTEAPPAADKHALRRVRVPAWGRFLRRTHLDEVPQLWCVLSGRMSLVGPRPEMVELAERFDRDFAASRTAIRPGITGLWQVSEGLPGLIAESPEYDLFYLRHQSLGLDAWILWRTVRMYLPGGGLATLADIPHWAAPGADTDHALDLATTGVD